MIIRGAECKISGTKGWVVLSVQITRHRQRGYNELVGVIVYQRKIIRTVVGKILKLYALCVKRITYENVFQEIQNRHSYLIHVGIF
jgi:hypothetical protein